MQGSFMGLGMKNVIGLFILFAAFIVIIKVGTLKYDKTPEGLKNFVQTI